MKTNGSIYVAAVFAALIGYFVYQWWFNPNRIVKARLGDIAAGLSVPERESGVNRLARLAQLRTLATPDLHLKATQSGLDFTSRDAVMAATGKPLGQALALTGARVFTGNRITDAGRKLPSERTGPFSVLKDGPGCSSGPWSRVMRRTQGAGAV